MGRLSQRENETILREPHISIISTLRPDGTPHMTPVWHLVDDDQVVVAVETTSVKARNVRRNPHVALCIALNESPQRWLLVNGTAALTQEDIPEIVRALSRHYLGATEGATYAADVLRKLQFVLLRITPTSMIGFDGQE